MAGDETIWNAIRDGHEARPVCAGPAETHTFAARRTSNDRAPEPPSSFYVAGARVLAYLGDSITTYDISPAGAIARSSPPASTWWTTTSRPGIQLVRLAAWNHEVMVRGTFAQRPHPQPA